VFADVLDVLAFATLSRGGGAGPVAVVSTTSAEFGLVSIIGDISLTRE